ncbi:SMI1/KNR4 family protein [Providencia sneebia]|uniref:Knr4/Smi1-like domain-containing protein n=1 Tax=Providencia sneebia DSM 19967 TaxID=1141660 RepID=K8WXB2_9GAMM|nr:SMI1/KNR4 family protein [Providencia sneebia]EKT60835.1 hypothetical protein OO7_02021 [Providencia sneebia DSM 19967]
MDEKQFIKLLTEFSNELKLSGFAVFGCNDEQIRLLEAKHGNLPQFYKIFLKFIGIDAGDFQTGTTISYIDLNNINRKTLERMHKNNIIPAGNIFTFSMYQNHTSLFFSDHYQDDPDVYCYDNAHKTTKTGKTFSQYLAAEFNKYRNANAFLYSYIAKIAPPSTTAFVR